MEYRLVLHAGTILDGKYRIERVIGSGGFGVTYEALDLALETAVAIKEYYPATFAFRDATMSVLPRTDEDREMFDRLRASFLREARTLARFESPAIVRVISVFEAHGTAYMVMKYEGGPNLKAWRQALGRRPTQRELDLLVAPLLESLEVLHAEQFLHRDIAPDNIIVRPDGSPVLLDFGASRRVMGELTGTLTAMIKPGFSPAEQYTADPRMQGPWTDIYALGATLYQTITGRKPLEALERFEDLTVMADVKGEGYRPGFLQAIEQAMRFRPENRPQSIAEFRETLMAGSDVRVQSRIVVTPRREGAGESGAVPRSRTLPPAPPTREQIREARSRPILASAGSAASAPAPGPSITSSAHSRPLQAGGASSGVDRAAGTSPADPVPPARHANLGRGTTAASAAAVSRSASPASGLSPASATADAPSEAESEAAARLSRWLPALLMAAAVLLGLYGLLKYVGALRP